jgi:hypothetical protein
VNGVHQLAVRGILPCRRLGRTARTAMNDRHECMTASPQQERT